MRTVNSWTANSLNARNVFNIINDEDLNTYRGYMGGALALRIGIDITYAYPGGFPATVNYYNSAGNLTHIYQHQSSGTPSQTQHQCINTTYRYILAHISGNIGDYVNSYRMTRQKQIPEVRLGGNFTVTGNNVFNSDVIATGNRDSKYNWIYHCNAYITYVFGNIMGSHTAP